MQEAIHTVLCAQVLLGVFKNTAEGHPQGRGHAVPEPGVLPAEVLLAGADVLSVLQLRAGDAADPWDVCGHHRVTASAQGEDGSWDLSTGLSLLLAAEESPELVPHSSALGFLKEFQLFTSEERFEEFSGFTKPWLQTCFQKAPVKQASFLKSFDVSEEANMSHW